MASDGRNKACGRGTAALLIVGTGLSLAGCSSLPDYANPVEWYRGASGTVGDWFSDDEEPRRSDEPVSAEAAGDAKTDAPGSGQGSRATFPSLSSVPAKPSVSSAEERQKLREGLVADRANAQYTDARPPASEAKAATPAAPRAAPQPPAQSAAAPARTPPPEPARAAAPAVPPQPAAPAPQPVARADTSAALPSAAYSSSGIKSRLWPYAPPPKSEGDRPVTSARVGEPTTSNADLNAARGTGDPSLSTAATIQRPSSSELGQGLFKATADRSAASQASSPMAPSSMAPSLTQAAPAPAPQQYAAAMPTPAPTPGFPPSAPPQFQLTPPASGAAQPPQYGQSAMPSTASYGAFQPLVPPTDDQAAVIRFGHGSATLTQQDRALIRHMAELAKRSGGVLVVVGHASGRTREMDPVSHELVNLEASAKRANVVADALIAAGVHPQQLIVNAVGASDPAVDESMPSGEAENRRAEIFLQQ